MSTSLMRLIAPRSLAFVGGQAMAQAAQRCLDGGFDGPVYLVSPKPHALRGVQQMQNVEDLPEGPDGVFLGVNHQLTLDLVPRLKAIGSGGVVCYASDFAETGPEGAARQKALIESAGDMALLGPNCYGLINNLNGAALWPVAHGGRRVAQGAAILTQSGNFAYNLSMIAEELPVAWMASVGNQGQTSPADLMDALLEDARITCIGLHMEGIKDVPGFARAAHKALLKGVPIVALKTGVSDVGAALAMGHTSSLSGSDSVTDALFHRLGVMRVDGVNAFIETMKAVSSGAAPISTDIAGFACSGGDAGFLADHAASAQLELPPLQSSTREALAQILPAYAQLANPLDFTTAIWGNPQALSQMFDAVIAGESAPTLVLALDFPSESSGERGACQMLLDVFASKIKASGKHGLVASVFPQLLPADVRAQLTSQGIPAFAGLQEALKAWGRWAAYGQKRQALLERGESAVPLLDSGDPAPAAASSLPPEVWSEWDSRQHLSRFGVPMDQAVRCRVEDAVALSHQVAKPLALKLVSPALPHKTEVGGVALNLHDASEVEQALNKMKQSLSSLPVPATLEEVMMEPMAAPVVAELLVGVKHEPGYGQALVLAVGGVAVEVLKDSVTLMLPTNGLAIRHALLSLRSAPLFMGFRGRPAADLDAAVDAIESIARGAQDLAPRLTELEVNPLLMHAKGCTAVDALITLRAPEASL